MRPVLQGFSKEGIGHSQDDGRPAGGDNTEADHSCVHTSANTDESECMMTVTPPPSPHTLYRTWCQTVQTVNIKAKLVLFWKRADAPCLLLVYSTHLISGALSSLQHCDCSIWRHLQAPSTRHRRAHRYSRRLCPGGVLLKLAVVDGEVGPEVAAVTQRSDTAAERGAQTNLNV